MWGEGRPSRDQFSYHTVPDPGRELAHPNSYPIYELLERAKELVLQNRGHRIFMTLDNSRISERSPGEGPELMV